MKNMLRENKPVSEILDLRIEDTPQGTIRAYWLPIVNNGIGEPIRLPILVARGFQDGPVLGLTAAIHGNELNGIPVIQELFSKLDVHKLCGTIIACLAVNVPGLLLEQRKFNEGTDLNHIAPGKLNGDMANVYMARLVERLLPPLQYLIDIHTASFGRVNSYYIRANMAKEEPAQMARLQNPEIILDNPAHDGTFRSTAMEMGIHAITLELKDPSVFQYDVIEDALIGVRNVLYDLKMLEGTPTFPGTSTILCDSSYWIYTDEGGILKVYPDVKQIIKKGELIADVRTIFGSIIKEYFASDDGIVIGKSVNPINQSGSRILHLGINPREMPPMV